MTTQSAELDLHPVYRFSGLGRPLDPARTIDKVVLIAVAVACVCAAAWGWWVDGDAPLGVGWAGVHAAVVLVLSWALTRELAPDDKLAGFVAVGLVALMWPRFASRTEGLDLAVLAGTLLAVRLVTRSVGKPATAWDAPVASALFLAVGVWASWTLVALGTVALALDAWLPAPNHGPRKRHMFYALGLAAATLVLVLSADAPLEIPAHPLVLAILGGLVALAVITVPEPLALGDVDREPLDHTRVRSGLGLGLAAALLLSVDSGLPLFAVAPHWACLSAVCVGAVILAVRRRLSTRDRKVGS